MVHWRPSVKRWARESQKRPRTGRLGQMPPFYPQFRHAQTTPLIEASVTDFGPKSVTLRVYKGVAWAWRKMRLAGSENCHRSTLTLRPRGHKRQLARRSMRLNTHQIWSIDSLESKDELMNPKNGRERAGSGKCHRSQNSVTLRWPLL